MGALCGTAEIRWKVLVRVSSYKAIIFEYNESNYEMVGTHTGKTGSWGRQ